MKKKMILAAILGLAILLAACKADTTNPDAAVTAEAGPKQTPDDEKVPDSELLTATITEENGDMLIVKPVEGSWELNSSDAIFAHKDWADESIRSLLTVGARVVIKYDGRIMESYPTQIYGEKMWLESIAQPPETASDNMVTDTPYAVMVNGELYISTGKESEITGRCGNMDGQITSAVDASQLPTEDNQSNFGTGYGYQYGTSNTIEVYMTDDGGEGKWIVFEKEDQGEERLPESGVTGLDMRLTSVSNKSIGFEIVNDTPAEINYGTDFQIVKIADNGTETILPTITDDYGFEYMAYAVMPESRAEDVIDFSELYGELEPGTYRLYKKLATYESQLVDGLSTHEYHVDFTVLSEEYTIDYGESGLYSYNDMAAAVAVILDQFKSWDLESGCRLHSLRYAGDECNSRDNIQRMNDLSPDGTVYTNCMEFLMDFHSPAEDAGAWNPDAEYTDWQWWLARSENGEWRHLTNGY